VRRPPRQAENFEDWNGPICSEQPWQACLKCSDYDHCDGCETPICRYAAITTDVRLFCRDCGEVRLLDDPTAADLRYNGPEEQTP